MVNLKDAINQFIEQKFINLSDADKILLSIL